MFSKSNLQLAIIGSIFLVASCSKDKNEEVVNVGVTHCCVTSDSFMWGVAKGIQNAASKMPVQLHFENAQGSQIAQLKQIKDMIKQGSKVILSSIVIDDTAQKPFQRQILDLTKSHHVPIIFYTIAPRIGFLQQYDHAYFVGSAPEQSGIMQGEMIVDQWRKNPQWDRNHDGVIQYVILKGPNGNPDAEERTKWVQATIKNYPDAGIQAKRLDLKSGFWQRDKAASIVEQWQKEGLLDHVEVIIANNDDMALGAKDYLEKQNIHLPIFGVDGLPEALKAIKERKISGTIKQDGIGQAKAAIQLADNIARGKPLDKDLGRQVIKKKVIVPYIKIDRSNVNNFL